MGDCMGWGLRRSTVRPRAGGRAQKRSKYKSGSLQFHPQRGSCGGIDSRPLFSNGEWSGSNPVKLDADEFKRVPILKDSYPKFSQSVSVGATAKLEGDRTSVVVTFSNNGDLPLLDFTLRNAKLGGDGDLAGEIDPASPVSPSEIKPGESRTFKVNFTNAPWDFSKSDSPFLNLVPEYTFQRSDSITFKGKTFQLPNLVMQNSAKTYMGVSVKRPMKPSGPATKP